MQPVRAWLLRLAFLVLVGLAGKAADAVPFVLTFDELQSFELIQDFYDGGTGGSGSSGPDLGVGFVGYALSLLDLDAGGNGTFANEPSEDSVVFFHGAREEMDIINVAAGFETGFSFYYSSTVAAVATVYDGLNATGNVLGTVTLFPQATTSEGCALPGDPTGMYACWDPAGVAFSGTALSVGLTGFRQFVLADNVTFGSSAPIPEPAAGALVGLGLLGLAAAGRKRRSACARSLRTGSQR